MGCTADSVSLEQAILGQREREGGLLLDLWLPAEVEKVPAARHEVLRICRQAGFTEDECFMLDLALGEALANAVLHGAPHEIGGPANYTEVGVRLWDYDGHLIIQVWDNGPGFDPPPLPYEMPSSPQATHGRGLPLMQTLTDAMLVSRGDVREGGTSLFLVKTLPGGCGEAAGS